MESILSLSGPLTLQNFRVKLGKPVGSFPTLDPVIEQGEPVSTMQLGDQIFGSGDGHGWQSGSSSSREY